MRVVLKDNLESRAACEWILECLWTVAKVCLSLSFTSSRVDSLSLSRRSQEKVDEEGPQPLELEVQIIALRRRGPDVAAAPEA